MIRTHGLLRAISRIADMELEAYPQSPDRVDFSTREADVVFEVHHDAIHPPSVEIGLTSDGGTHRIIIPRSLHPKPPIDGSGMVAFLRMIQRAASFRSDPTSFSLRRRYDRSMRIAALFPDGIAVGGGRSALGLVAATPISGARVVAQNGHRLIPQALRVISDFIPHGRTTRVLFQTVPGMTRTWEIHGLETPIGIVEPVGAMERLRIVAELGRDFADDPERLELVRLACVGTDMPARRAA